MHVIDLNRQVMQQMNRDLPVELGLMEGTTHLSEEPGTLEQAAELARDWFTRFLIGRSESGKS